MKEVNVRHRPGVSLNSNVGDAYGICNGGVLKLWVLSLGSRIQKSITGNEDWGSKGSKTTLVTYFIQ